LFWEIFFKGFVIIPADTLVGANLPWRDYKWGYTVGVPVKNPPLSDVFSQFFVWKKITADLLKSGVLPLLNPYSFSGNSIIGTYHTGVFFPTTLLFLILPFMSGWNLHILLSIFSAGLFMAWYLKRHVRSHPAVIVGSLIFALSGLMTTWAELGTAVWAMAFIPLLLISIEKGNIKAISSVIFLIISAGNLQIVTYIIPISLVYVLIYQKTKATITRSILALVLGIGLSAIILLPAADFARESIRSAEQFSQTINLGLTPDNELIRLWAADFFGSPVTYNHWGTSSYHENSNFLGVIGTYLVLSALFLKSKNKLGKFFSLLFVFSLILGYQNPFSNWLFNLNIPILTFSSASRVFFLTTLSASVLSALYLDQLKKVNWLPLILIILTLLFLKTVPVQYFTISLRNSLIPVIFLGVVQSFRFIRLSPKIMAVVLIFLSVVELGRYFRKYNPMVRNDLVFPTTPVIDYLINNQAGYRLINETDEIFPPNTWSYYGLQSPEGYDPVYSQNYSNFFKVSGRGSYTSKPHRYLDFTDVNSRFLDILSVKYLAAKTRDDTYLTPIKSRVVNSGWHREYSDKSVELWSNPDVLPKISSLTAYTNYPEFSDFQNDIQNPDFDPRSKILFYPPQKIPEDLATAKISGIAEIPNGLQMHYFATNSALLLISQGYIKGWTATVNLLPVPVFPADGGLISAIVPPGVNMHFQLKYFPKSLLWGSLISLMSGVFLHTRFKINS
jgi:hypothetical protein